VAIRAKSFSPGTEPDTLVCNPPYFEIIRDRVT
jgi:hypothetical protein